MSKWGLSYKGVEPLYVSDWNNLVKALNDLTNRIKCGLAEFDGDGSQFIFSIEHGLGVIPASVIVTKAERNLPDIDYVKADELYIHVAFKNAPEPGDKNVKIWWVVLAW